MEGAESMEEDETITETESRKKMKREASEAFGSDKDEKIARVFWNVDEFSEGNDNISCNIKSFLSRYGYNGPIIIKAYGRTSLPGNAGSNGIQFERVDDTGGKNNAVDRKICLDILSLVVERKMSAINFLLSSSPMFYFITGQLTRLGYAIFVVERDTMHQQAFNHLGYVDTAKLLSGDEAVVRFARLFSLPDSFLIEPENMRIHDEDDEPENMRIHDEDEE